MTGIPAALLLAFVAGAAAAQDGHALYTGLAGQLADPAAERRLARFPCHRCHGRDGLGGVEGDVPPIDWRLLSQPAAGRPGYDAETFHRAVTQGLSSDGRVLSRLMPRYAFSVKETELLQDYLRALHDRQRQGVMPDALRIGVAVLPGAEAVSEDYRVALQDALVTRLGGDSVYGRQVVLVPVVLDQARNADGVLAVLGPPVAAAETFAARGVPILAPIGALDGSEDTSVLRGITPSREVLYAKLAQELASTGQGDVSIIASDAHERDAMVLALSLAAPGRGVVTEPEKAEDIVLLVDAPPSVGTDWTGRLWVTWQSLASRGALPPDAQIMVALETPRIIDDALDAQVHPLVIHARHAGIVLAEALKAAGRDVTRAQLLQALAETVLDDIGLDYDRFPLTGTEKIAIFPMR